MRGPTTEREREGPYGDAWPEADDKTLLGDMESPNVLENEVS